MILPSKVDLAVAERKREVEARKKLLETKVRRAAGGEGR